MLSGVKIEKIKVYIAGKISPSSVFGTHDWRDNFCANLSEKSGLKIVNLDPTKSQSEFNLDENDSELIFGRDCFMIKSSDLVIVYLTDDISVGGSQEMLLAKYYNKPLIGIAPQDGKFNRKEKEILGKVYKNWIHPFVKITCDIVVEDISDAAIFIKEFFLSPEQTSTVKDMSIIDNSVNYYEEKFYHLDKLLHFD